MVEKKRGLYKKMGDEKWAEDQGQTRATEPAMVFRRHAECERRREGRKKEEKKEENDNAARTGGTKESRR